VRVLLERGHHVAALDLPSKRLDALARKGACVPVGLDLTSTSAWAEALEATTRELGQPTGAVLCAGGWAGGTPVHETAPDDGILGRMVALNVQTTERSIRALMPGMVAAEHGSVVVVGSRAVERPWESAGAAHYTAAKSAVVAYAKAVAAEVLDSKVRVNAVMPSVIDTPRNRADMPSADPLRWVSPESLARVIAFLLSDDARDISGAAIPVYARA
jgi:NAD(P)-dependent dehydrogenase (short-subunit alcohol dehydrogenase family)